MYLPHTTRVFTLHESKLRGDIINITFTLTRSDDYKVKRSRES